MSGAQLGIFLWWVRMIASESLPHVYRYSRRVGTALSVKDDNVVVLARLGLPASLASGLTL